MNLNKKAFDPSNKNTSIAIVMFCYLVWGFQPLYFNLKEVDAMFLLMTRILAGCLLLLVLLLLQGRGQELINAFKNRDLMLKHLLPAAVFNFLDWGIYMIAVMTGHVMDTSLGYYVTPLVVCFIGVIAFKEKITWESIAATVLVLVGIIASGNEFSSSPWIAISLMICFPIYAAFMKGVKEDSILCTCIQLICTAPICILYILFFRMGENGMASVDFNMFLFLIGAGLVTVIPIVCYASSVKHLPMILIGFLQYLSPTFGLICGYMLNESLTQKQLIGYIFIWAGVIIYSIVTALREKKNATEQAS